MKKKKIKKSHHIDKDSTGEAPSLSALRSYYTYRKNKIFPYTTIKANLERQYRATMPREYYVDIEYICRNCGCEFIFYATEQKFWYEDLKFYLDAFPGLCLTCRKNKRVKIDAKKFYDSQIKLTGTDTHPKLLCVLIDAIDCQAKPDGSLPSRMIQQRNRLVNLIGDAKLRT